MTHRTRLLILAGSLVKLVGTGITPLLPSKGMPKGRRAKLAELWRHFVDRSDPEGRHDFYGQQLLAARTWRQDRRTPPDLGPRRPTPLVPGPAPR